jgi:hypothetical protein
MRAIKFKTATVSFTLLFTGLLGMVMIGYTEIWRCADYDWGPLGWRGGEKCFIGECESDTMNLVQPCVMECISGGIYVYMGCEFPPENR